MGILEVRADLLGDLDPNWLRSHFRGELLYTLRSRAEGGAFEGGKLARRKRLAAAAPRYDLVDLEADRDLQADLLLEVPAAKRLIFLARPGDPLHRAAEPLRGARRHPGPPLQDDSARRPGGRRAGRAGAPAVAAAQRPDLVFDRRDRHLDPGGGAAFRVAADLRRVRRQPGGARPAQREAAAGRFPPARDRRAGGGLRHRRPSGRPLAVAQAAQRRLPGARHPGDLPALPRGFASAISGSRWWNPAISPISASSCAACR